MKKCEICGGEFKNLGAHMKAHKGEDDGVQEVERPKIPKWRLQTPVFGPGQVGMRIPRHRLEKGVK